MRWIIATLKGDVNLLLIGSDGISMNIYGPKCILIGSSTFAGGNSDYE